MLLLIYGWLPNGRFPKEELQEKAGIIEKLVQKRLGSAKHRVCLVPSATGNNRDLSIVLSPPNSGKKLKLRINTPEFKMMVAQALGLNVPELVQVTVY